MVLEKNLEILKNRLEPWDSKRFPEESTRLGGDSIHAKRIELDESLRPFFDLGKLAAEVHCGECVFIDMRVSNVGYRANTQQMLISDYSATMIYGCVPPPLERARDLAVLRMECNYQQWQAVKAGYWERDPEAFDDVFRLFDQRGDN